MKTQHAKYFWAVIIVLGLGIFIGIYWAENKEVLINTLMEHFEVQKYWYYSGGMLVIGAVLTYLILKILNKKDRRETSKLTLWIGGSIVTSTTILLIFLGNNIANKISLSELFYSTIKVESLIFWAVVWLLVLTKKFKKKEIET